MYRRTSPEIKSYVIEYHKGVAPKEMARRVSELFGEPWTHSRMKNLYGRNHLSSGLDSRFHKGHVPANKGRRMEEYLDPDQISRIRATQFWKGHRSSNAFDVGSEVFRGDGYLWRKISEPDVWRQVHILLWESENGPVPDGMMVTFLNGDRHDIRLENLALITRRENQNLTRRGFRAADEEITKTGLNIVRLINAAKERENEG